jgi:PASTA domain-containing protein
MLSESEARDLLALAGATIEVSPVTTLPEVPPRRRWPVLAAAAAVLALVSVGAALGLRSGDDAPVGVTVPRVDFQGRADVLGDGQIPSVFGYSGAAALTMLTDRGLEVTIGNWVVPCADPAGRAVRTQPAVGARFQPGDTVVLFVSVRENRPCPANADQALAWQLIDFANGRGPAPGFADQVVVTANGASATIPAALAADPSTWVDGSPLGVLRQQSREVKLSTGYSFQTPFLATGASPKSPRCHRRDPSGVPGSDQGLSISIEFLADGVGLDCTVVDVFRTDGLISAVSLRTGQLSLPDTE